MPANLPEAADGQPFIQVSALESGFITLPRHLYVAGSSPDEKTTCPSLSFLLRHSSTGRNLVFDLGLGKDTSKYPPSSRKMIETDHPVSIPNDVVDSLRKGGLEPGDIEDVVISHLHFDQFSRLSAVGEPSLFPDSRFILHEDAKPVLQSRYPNGLIPPHQIHWLKDTELNCAAGPFPKALDYYNDGSLYLISSPGHLPGHVNILARTSTGPTNSWIYLAGDSAHNPCIIRGCCEIAVYQDKDGKMDSAHEDLEVAKAHIERVKEMVEDPRVMVVLAHDFEWYEEDKGKAFFPGTIEPVGSG